MSYWVDTALGAGGDDGTTPADSKRGTSAIKTGFEVDHNAGVICWFRRTSAYDEGVVGLNADIAPTADGTAALPVYFMAWPRAAIPDTEITEGDWTNGNTTVDNIVGINCTRTAHQARWATAPNGKKYFITRVVDANTIIIDREYAGGTVNGVGGKFQINQDWNYQMSRNDPQLALAIAAGWDADAHDLPTIDFNDESYNLVVSGDNYLVFSGFNGIDSLDGNGIFYASSGIKTLFKSILFKQNASNAPCVSYSTSKLYMDEFTIEGSAAGTNQNGVGAPFGNHGIARLKNGAIYNMGNHGVAINYGTVKLTNINIGVEIENVDDDISLRSAGSNISGMDVKLGGNNGYVLFDASTPGEYARFENYGKILGDQHSWFYSGEWERIAVTSTNANKKLSDYVLRVTPNGNQPFVLEEWKQIIFDGSFELSAGAQNIKFWLFNDLGATINDDTAKDNVFLRAPYVDDYDDSSKYTMLNAYSTEIDILDAADADDWDSLSVAIIPDTASKVRVQLMCGVYSAAGVFLIDPEPVVT